MKKYERLIKSIIQLDKASFEIFEKKISCGPGSKEWENYKDLEDELELLIRKELQSLDKCIKWYRQSAKTAEDIELIVELEDERNRLYEHCICDLTNEEINTQSDEMVRALLGALNIPSDLSEEPDNTQDDIEAGSEKEDQVVMCKHGAEKEEQVVMCKHGQERKFLIEAVMKPFSDKPPEFVDVFVRVTINGIHSFVTAFYSSIVEKWNPANHTYWCTGWDTKDTYWCELSELTGVLADKV